MYAVTTTRGLIIESRPYGEAGKLLSVFTRDLGLVIATAQGIRLERSKLRYHAQEYSFGTFSFVRGREFWRMTSAGGEAGRKKHEAGSREHGEGSKEHEAGSGEHEAERLQNELVARIALLLRRLLHGEEAHPELFDDIDSAFRFLGDCESLSAEQLDAFESLLVYRILRHLGYIGDDQSIGPGFIEKNWSVELVDSISNNRKKLNAHINKALKASHL